MVFGLVELVFLPVIFLLGIITSYQDIKYGKIKNKWIILALVYTVVAYIFLILYHLSIGGIRTEYLIELGTNFLFTIAVGFGLFLGKIWTEGDGKLFIAYSALIPLSFYSHGYIKWFPSFSLLINIFVIGFLMMILVILIKSKIEDINKSFVGFVKEFFDVKQLASTIIYIFAVLWIVQIMLLKIKLNNNFILTMVFTILVTLVIQTKLKNKYMLAIIMIIIAGLRFFIDKSIYSLDFLINFIVLIIIFGFVKSFSSGSFHKLSKKVFSKEKETIPFAPFMFTGVVITLLARGNFLLFLRIILMQ